MGVAVLPFVWDARKIPLPDLSVPYWKFTNSLPPFVGLMRLVVLVFENSCLIKSIATIDEGYR